MSKHISYIALCSDNPETGKTKTVRSSDFKRMAYWMEEYPEFVFVHYIGNDAIAKDFVHGNTRDKKARVHAMTNKSTRDEIREKGFNNEKPANIYKNMTVDNISKDEAIQNILVQAPRNSKQCANLKFLAKNKSILSQDQWWNALCQSYEYQDGTFVKSINIYTNLESTVVHPGLQDDLNFIMKVLYDVKRPGPLVSILHLPCTMMTPLRLGLSLLLQ